MNDKFVNIKYFSPTGYIGFWILFIGLIFTEIIFYFVFFRLNIYEESNTSREIKSLEEDKQKEKIARLYPKKTKIES